MSNPDDYHFEYKIDYNKKYSQGHYIKLAQNGIKPQSMSIDKSIKNEKKTCEKICECIIL